MGESAHMTEERRMMQESARDFVAKEILPVANELDPIQGDIPMDLRRKMGEMGYFGIQLPEEHGGLGLARLTKNFEGTSEIQLRIISDHILGKPTSRVQS